MDNKIFYVAGKKGSGKTSLVKRYIIPKFPKIVILDSLDEYSGVRTESISQFIDVLNKNLERRAFIIKYVPLDESETDFFMAGYLLRDVTIIVEEADLYSNAHNEDPFFRKIIRYGRHRNLNLVCISRRPAEVSRNITAQADIIVSFRQTEPIDLKYFAKISEKWKDLPNLSKYVYPRKHRKNIDFTVILGEEYNFF